MLAVRRTQRDRLTLSTYIDLEELLISTLEIHQVARDGRTTGRLKTGIGHGHRRPKTQDRQPKTDDR